MLARTKKPHTEIIQFVGSPDVIARLREYALQVGAGIVDSAETIPAAEISPEIDSNPVGTYLRGIRTREDLTQEQLARLTAISRSNISAMEHGKRPIGKEMAKKLAAVLRCDYRRFL